MEPRRYAFDGQGVIYADSRVIARDNPNNPESGQDLTDLTTRANLAAEMAAVLRLLVSDADLFGADLRYPNGGRVARYRVGHDVVDRARAILAQCEGV